MVNVFDVQNEPLRREKCTILSVLMVHEVSLVVVGEDDTLQVVVGPGATQPLGQECVLVLYLPLFDLSCFCRDLLMILQKKRAITTLSIKPGH